MNIRMGVYGFISELILNLVFNIPKKIRFLYVIYPIAFVVYAAGEILPNICSDSPQSAYVISKNTISAYNKNYLTHGLIYDDEVLGVSSPLISKKAYARTNAFFNEVNAVCTEGDDISAFLSCGNKILSKYFYYKASTFVSNSYAEGYSDCDSNVYLLLDAAKSKNIKLYVVYTPGHALISWYQKNGEPLFWETTINQNRGSLINIHNPYYRKTKEPFYFRPEDIAFVKALYPVLVLDDIPDDKLRQMVVTRLDASVRNTPLFADYFFEHKHPLTVSDVSVLNRLILTDTTSTEKRVLLAKYYFAAKNNPAAMRVLKTINPLDCGPICLEYMRSQKYEYALRYYIDGYFKLRHETIPRVVRERVVTSFLYCIQMTAAHIFLFELCLLSVTVLNLIKKGRTS